MNKISPKSSQNPKFAQQRSEARTFRLAPTLPRVATGLTAAVAGASAAFFVFGPFSDLSARQLANGPQGSALDSDGKPIVLARTGRSWGAEAERRAAAASAAPVATLAVIDAASPRATK